MRFFCEKTCVQEVSEWNFFLSFFVRTMENAYICICEEWSIIKTAESMTIDEVLELKKQGHIEDAYNGMRAIYATDKSVLTAKTMFWTAVDVLKKRIGEGRTEEASKIYLALVRLVDNTIDADEPMRRTLSACRELLGEPTNTDRHVNTSGEHLRTGEWGEGLASAYLCDKGYIILDRDWHSGHRDIDIIARQGECTVFVEVKTRRSHEYCEPEMAVNYQKQKNLLYAINHYLHYRHIEGPWRFDVITVIGIPSCLSTEIKHIVDFSLNVVCHSHRRR